VRQLVDDQLSDLGGCLAPADGLRDQRGDASSMAWREPGRSSRKDSSRLSRSSERHE